MCVCVTDATQAYALAHIITHTASHTQTLSLALSRTHTEHHCLLTKSQSLSADAIRRSQSLSSSVDTQETKVCHFSLALPPPSSRPPHPRRFSRVVTVGIVKRAVLMVLLE
jgi:hypothetical protein